MNEDMRLVADSRQTMVATQRSALAGLSKDERSAVMVSIERKYEHLLSDRKMAEKRGDMRWAKILSSAIVIQAPTIIYRKNVQALESA